MAGIHEYLHSNSASHISKTFILSVIDREEGDPIIECPACGGRQKAPLGEHRLYCNRGCGFSGDVEVHDE